MSNTISGIKDFEVRPMDSPSQYMAPYSAFYSIKGPIELSTVVQ